MWKSVLSASEYLCMIICTTETKRACVSVVLKSWFKYAVTWTLMKLGRLA